MFQCTEITSHAVEQVLYKCPLVQHLNIMNIRSIAHRDLLHFPKNRFISFRWEITDDFNLIKPLLHPQVTHLEGPLRLTMDDWNFIADNYSTTLQTLGSKCPYDTVSWCILNDGVGRLMELSVVTFFYNAPLNWEFLRHIPKLRYCILFNLHTSRVPNGFQQMYPGVEFLASNPALGLKSVHDYWNVLERSPLRE